MSIVFSPSDSLDPAHAKICIAIPGLKCPTNTIRAESLVLKYLQIFRGWDSTGSAFIGDQSDMPCSGLDNRRQPKLFQRTWHPERWHLTSCELGYESNDGIPSKQSRSRRKPSIFIHFSIMMTVPLPSRSINSVGNSIPHIFGFHPNSTIEKDHSFHPFLVANSIPAFADHFCFWLQHSRLKLSNQLNWCSWNMGKFLDFSVVERMSLSENIRNMMVSKPFPKLERHLNRGTDSPPRDPHDPPPCRKKIKGSTMWLHRNDMGLFGNSSKPNLSG